MNDIIYGSALLGSIGYAGFLFWKIFRKERLFPVLAWTVLSGYAIVMTLMAINLFHIIKSHIH